MKTAALILAGGTLSPELMVVAEGATNRALIPLAPGRVMLDYVVEALRAGFAEEENGGGRILLAGDDIPLPPGCIAVPGGETLVDTLLNGVAALSPDETQLLVATADIPFLTAEAVSDLLHRAQSSRDAGADFAYPIVEAARCHERFPTMKRTTLRIREGEFTGGNLVLLNPAFLRSQEQVIRDAYARRKDIGKLARLLGPRMLARLMVSRIVPGALAIAHLEAAVGHLLGGATARAIVTPYAEIGVDIDRPEDVLIARAMLSPSPIAG
ncbi:MAG: nucleotidyltransferase family protein [Cytophagales bacterium]|nr:nucleotidyltransferase family protein [Armatimonadota bacterium]